MMQGERDPIDAVIGNRVRVRRMTLNVSQEALGNALGVSFQQVQKYEKGFDRIAASRLVHIARYLKTPMSFFYDNLDSDDTPSNVKLTRHSSEAIAMAVAFQKIGKAKVRESLFLVACALAGEA